MAKLTNEQVLQIREMASQGLSSRKITKSIGVVRQTAILRIINRITWNHI